MSTHAAWVAALEQLKSATIPNLRSEAIDQMTELLQEDDWALPDGLGGDIVSALRDQLYDTNWCAPAAGGDSRCSSRVHATSHPPLFYCSTT